MAKLWQHGDIMLEEVFTGATRKLCYVRPAIVIEDTPQYLAFYYPLGYTFASSDYLGVPRPATMTAADYVARRYDLSLDERVNAFLTYEPSIFREIENTRWHIVYIQPSEGMHAYWLFWDANWDLLSWFVNLQAPCVRTERGIRTTDFYLDLVVTPDLKWRWKDEDEFEALCGRGVFSPAERRAIVAEGELVAGQIEAREWPFNAAWPQWRPEASWPVSRINDHWPPDLPFPFLPLDKSSRS